MADYVEIQIEAGATFSTEIVVRDGATNLPKNLVSYTAKSQMRKSYYSSSASDFDVVISDSVNGIITMGMSAANTSNLRPGRYVYDVEIKDSSNVVTRIFEGTVTVLPNVTRI